MFFVMLLKEITVNQLFHSVTPIVTRTVSLVTAPFKRLGVVGILLLLAFVLIQVAPALASPGPYADTAGVGTAIQNGTGSGQEAAGALDALRKVWILPVVAAIAGIAVIVAFFGLIYRSDKRELFERIITVAAIGFLTMSASTVLVVALATWSTHIQGATIH
jgi:hypothetical protein